MKIYTLCGSMRFAAEMQKIAYDLEARQGIATLPCVCCPDGITPSKQEIDNLSDAHFRKIDVSDGIYVVNIDGYIGASTRAEIEYAQSRGKEIIYHRT